MVAGAVTELGGCACNQFGLNGRCSIMQQLGADLPIYYISFRISVLYNATARCRRRSAPSCCIVVIRAVHKVYELMQGHKCCWRHSATSWHPVLVCTDDQFDVMLGLLDQAAACGCSTDLVTPGPPTVMPFTDKYPEYNRDVKPLSADEPMRLYTQHKASWCGTDICRCSAHA
jgi:hypothetical protein